MQAFRRSASVVAWVMGAILLVVLGTAPRRASAALVGTFVNATGGSGGNTVRSSDLDPSAWFIASPPSASTDNKWTFRNDAAAIAAALGGDVWESDGRLNENVPQVTTTITGLTPARYDVYVVYESNSVSPWGLQAALAGSPLTVFDKTNPSFTGPTALSITQYEGYLGSIVTLTGDIAVNVDDRPVHVAGDDRSWYDGIAYVQTGPVPEPAAVAALAMPFVAGLLKRSRRRRARGLRPTNSN